MGIKANKIEELFTDITFAEAKEFEPLKETLCDISERLEKTLIAVTFAETGEHVTAVSYIK